MWSPNSSVDFAALPSMPDGQRAIQLLLALHIAHARCVTIVPPAVVQLGLAGLAGALGAICVYPIDLVKTRLQSTAGGGWPTRLVQGHPAAASRRSPREDHQAIRARCGGAGMRRGGQWLPRRLLPGGGDQPSGGGEGAHAAFTGRRAAHIRRGV
eukprot:scaffold10931_cov75-Phaeocystis_antarctica.AAC.7